MKERIFTADDVWNGGFYELAIEVGPPSDQRLRAVLEAIWQHPDLDGCYSDRGREPAEQPRKLPDRIEGYSHLQGIARLPNGSRVACGTCLIREEDDGSDWLDFYVPMGALGTAYPSGGFPFGTNADWPGPWRQEVEDWLAAIGQQALRATAFRLAIIGFEVSGQVYAAEIAARGIPEERFVGYLWPSGGSIVYHRRNAD
jgi:hypothetical protein